MSEQRPTRDGRTMTRLRGPSKAVLRGTLGNEGGNGAEPADAEAAEADGPAEADAEAPAEADADAPAEADADAPAEVAAPAEAAAAAAVQDEDESAA